MDIIKDNKKFLKFSNILIITISIFFLFLIIKYTSRDLVQYYFYFQEAKRFNVNFWDWYFTGMYKVEYGGFNPSSDQIGISYIYWSLSKNLTYFQTFFIVSIISLIIKFYLFNRFLEFPKLAFIVYMISFAFIWEGNQLSQGVALIFLIYLVFSNKNNFLTDIGILFLSMLFHLTISIFFLYPIIHVLRYMKIRLDESYLIIYILTIVALFLLYLIGNYSNISGLLDYYLNHPRKVNLFGTVFLLQLALVISMLTYKGKLGSNQRKGLYLLFVGTVVYIMFNEVSLIASRFREISIVGAFPLLFARMEKFSINVAISRLCFSLICIYNFYLVIYMYIKKPFVQDIINF